MSHVNRPATDFDAPLTLHGHEGGDRSSDERHITTLGIAIYVEFT